MGALAIRMGLERPTQFYATLRFNPAFLKQEGDFDEGVHYAIDWAREFKKSNLLPDKHWYAKRRSFVKQPRKPTIAPTPAAKGKAAILSSPKGGGISRAIHGVVSSFEQLAPHRPAALRPVFWGCRKKLEND